MAAYPSVNMANQYARDVLNGKILPARASSWHASAILMI